MFVTVGLIQGLALHCMPAGRPAAYRANATNAANASDTVERFGRIDLLKFVGENFSVLAAIASGIDVAACD
jgi:hypothetical protein